jgi:predicted RNA methylase
MPGDSPSSRLRRPRAAVHDRGYLLGAENRDDVLALSEVQRYGSDSFGDPDYVTIYGLRPAEWYARGVRLLARTAVECTRDALADRIGRDVAAVARAARGISQTVVVDPFVGSANTLYWLARHLRAHRAVGFELDKGVYEATRRNLTLVNLGVTLRRTDHDAGLAALRISADELLIVFVAPPWGDALDPVSGLDLRGTQPSVPAIVDLVARRFSSHKVLLATQVYEKVVAASLAEAVAGCQWSQLKIYDIDAPGHNHGLLLATLGWTP